MTVSTARYLVAVTACVSGVAHTYMAAERLEKLCQQENGTLKLKPRGAGHGKLLNGGGYQPGGCCVADYGY
jgi:Phosphotransferase system fructose-specific component IIB